VHSTPLAVTSNTGASARSPRSRSAWGSSVASVFGGRTVEIIRKAERDLAKLPPKDRARVIEHFERLAGTGVGDVQAIEGEPGKYRLRVGDLRAFFERRDAPPDSDEPGAIVVIRVLNRREAYR